MCNNKALKNCPGLSRKSKRPRSRCLHRAARRRHDVVPVIVGDRREREMPSMGLVEFTDPESGEKILVDTGRHAVRRRFAERVANRADERKMTFRRMKIDPIEIETGIDFVEPLTAYFRRRERRRSR